MKQALKPIALAVLVAAAQIAGAQPPKASNTPAAPASASTKLAKAPIATRSVDDFITYEDVTYAPVVDAVSRHLDAARKAFDAKDDATAAAELHAAASELKRQAARAAKADIETVKADRALEAADHKHGQDTVARLDNGARKVESAAVAIKSGRIETMADLDKVIDKAARADMDRRWEVADVITWYPASEEPQRQFTQAVAAYARQDYQAAATDIRKAIGYLRLESNRADADAKQALDHAIAQLDALAASVASGTTKSERSMAGAFATADHALALEHRSKAAEYWARKEYDRTGYELMAAARGLESAAGWVGDAAKADVSATVTDVRALGERLAAGGAWTRDEVSQAFASLGDDIDATGTRAASAKTALSIGGPQT
jgi:hypothetical protein